MGQYNDDQKIFGGNLYLLRKVHRLSQKEVANIMGVSIYCVRKAEQGVFTNSLHMDAIINLSRHFRMRPSLLFAPREQWTVGLLLNGEGWSESAVSEK